MSVLFSKLLFVNSKCTSFWFPDWISAHFPSPFPSGFLLVLPIEPARGKLTVGAQGVVTSSLPGLFTHRHTSMGTVPGTVILWRQYWVLFALLESWVSRLNRCSLYLGTFSPPYKCGTSVCFGFLLLFGFSVLFFVTFISLPHLNNYSQC